MGFDLVNCLVGAVQGGAQVPMNRGVLYAGLTDTDGFLPSSVCIFRGRELLIGGVLGSLSGVGLDDDFRDLWSGWGAFVCGTVYGCYVGLLVCWLAVDSVRTRDYVGCAWGGVLVYWIGVKCGGHVCTCLWVALFVVIVFRGGGGW